MGEGRHRKGLPELRFGGSGATPMALTAVTFGEKHRLLQQCMGGGDRVGDGRR
jgi:hypothetical protein